MVIPFFRPLGAIGRLMVRCGKTLHKQYSGKIAHLTINKVFPIARASGVAVGEKFGGECKWPVIYCNQLQERRHVSEQKLSRCSLFIAVQGAINLHPCALLVRGRKAPCAWRGPPLRKHISQLAALSGNSSPLLSPPKLNSRSRVAAGCDDDENTKKVSTVARDVGCNWSRGAMQIWRCWLSSRPHAFWKARREKRDWLLVGVEVIWTAKNAGGALELK